MKFFRKVKIIDRTLSQFQDNVATILQPLSKNAIIDGTFVDVTLISGSNTVNHTLGRVPLGFIITSRDSAATVYNTAWDSTTVSLTASASLNATIYFF